MDKEWILSFSYHHHISWGETYYLFHKIIPAKTEISYFFGIIISAKRGIENYLIFLLSYRLKGIQKDILSFYASLYQPNSDKIYERGGGKTELNYKKTWSWRSREIFHVFLFFSQKLLLKKGYCGIFCDPRCATFLIKVPSKTFCTRWSYYICTWVLYKEEVMVACNPGNINFV